MRRALLIVPFLLLVACSDDDASSDTTAPPITAEDEGTACDQLDGMDTDDVTALLDSTGCIDDDGQPLIAGNANLDCTDGTTLYWNDQGWGYSDDTWHAHDSGELVAPDSEQAACTG